MFHSPYIRLRTASLTSLNVTVTISMAEMKPSFMAWASSHKSAPVRCTEYPTVVLMRSACSPPAFQAPPFFGRVSLEDRESYPYILSMRVRDGL